MRDADSPKHRMNGLDSFIAAVEEMYKRKNPTVPLDEVREDLVSRCMDRWLILDRREKMFFSRRTPSFKVSIKRDSLLESVFHEKNSVIQSKHEA